LSGEFPWSMSDILTGRHKISTRLMTSRGFCGFMLDLRNPDFYKGTHETRGTVYKVSRPLISSASVPYIGRTKKSEQEAKHMAVKEKIRVRLKSYDHTLIDAAAAKIVDAAKRNGATVSGPIPLPTEKEIITILRAVHKYKDSREQFETRTHKRLIDIIKPSQKVVEALMGLEIPAGVDMEVKL